VDEVPVWTRFVLAGRVRRRAETRNSNHRRWPLAFDCEFCPGRSLCGLPGNCGKRNSTEGMPHRLLTPEALPACAEFSSASQGFTKHGTRSYGYRLSREERLASDVFAFVPALAPALAAGGALGEGSASAVLFTPEKRDGKGRYPLRVRTLYFFS
jgi:hypothetical protein